MLPTIITDIKDKLLIVRDQAVLLDCDVATLYGVQTREVNQAIRNNPDKFPDGYVIELSKEEVDDLRSNFLTANLSPKARYAPKAFTEKGLYMLATILKSPAATQATISIVETFAQVRALKHDVLALHSEKEPAKQKKLMQRFSDTLTDIVMPELDTSETESTIEINFMVAKFKHTIKRTKHKEGDK